MRRGHGILQIRFSRRVARPLTNTKTTQIPINFCVNYRSGIIRDRRPSSATGRGEKIPLRERIDNLPVS
jgi:hypothetical protein